mmetsp:Transcript_36513/g.116261  ORF Transcript_36513/g.116261 Transcript_36513/m.116261 type:complete len:214 (-) Transcript_36513:196-837(-)
MGQLVGGALRPYRVLVSTSPRLRSRGQSGLGRATRSRRAHRRRKRNTALLAASAGASKQNERRSGGRAPGNRARLPAGGSSGGAASPALRRAGSGGSGSAIRWAPGGWRRLAAVLHQRDRRLHIQPVSSHPRSVRGCSRRHRPLLLRSQLARRARWVGSDLLRPGVRAWLVLCPPVDFFWGWRGAARLLRSHDVFRVPVAAVAPVPGQAGAGV